MMPYAKGVSAKSHDFDANGNETQTDFAKMLKVVKDAGYRGHIGIEYEGSKLSPYEGIKAKIRPTHIIALEMISKLSLMGPIPKVNRIIIKSIKLIIATRSVSERKLIKKSLLICVTNTNNQLEPFEII